MAADPSKVSYCSLPGEIRNKIMILVLVPGDVYPHTPVPNTSTKIPVSAANVQSRSGVQLLGTCRQAYDEGHALFYSSNTFHLPANMTFEWSDRLQPKHKCLIKRIGITIGPNELDTSTICQIDRAYRDLRLTKSDGFSVIEEAVCDTLGQVWTSKMGHIAAWSSLEEITFCSSKDPIICTFPFFDKPSCQYHERTIQHCELVANLETLEFWYGFSEQSPGNSWSRYWNKILWWPCLIVLANILTKNDETTWAAAIEWLHVRKPDELAGDYSFWDRVENIEGGLYQDP